MLSTLERFDGKTAAGILARAAIALNEQGNPDAVGRIQNEREIRESLIREVAKKLGIEEPNILSPSSIREISEYLDKETEELAGRPNIPSAFNRLISSGGFPSDLYDIRIVPNISENLGKRLYEKERGLIEKTVRQPMVEQHFGPPENDGEPFLISLFARRFITRFPQKDFTMLVGGQRGDGKILDVHQAWRIYDSQIKSRQNASLVELLKGFADVFGNDVEINIAGKVGHFFLTAPEVPKVEFSIGMGKAQKVTVTYFVQKDLRLQRPRAALVVGINVRKYVSMLKSMDAEILE